MRFVALLLIGVFSVHAKLEDFDGLEELMNDPNLLSELEKRLGDILAEDRVDSDKNDELPCNATNGTLKAEQSSCGFDTQTGLIIKTSDSLRQKATFVGKTENVQCARDCAMQCCNNTKCDTAVYQNKESHKCYLFQCSLPGLGNVCVFDPHSNYSVSYMRSRSFNSLPGADHVSHENDLESLGSHLLRPEPVETVAPTTIGPLQTTTVQPGLGDTCSRYGPKCLDPHAECFMRECSCRAGYHNKYGICQHLCGKEEFECVNQGLSPRAKQCIHESLLCDGNRDCDDGSDEFITNCPKIDEDNQPRLNTDKQASNYKPKGPVESADVDHADKVSPVQPPKQTQDTGAQAGSQNSPDSHPAPGPQQPEEPQSEPDDITALAPSLNDQDNTKTEKQQPDEDSKKSNDSDSRETEKNGFTFFSQGASEKVESYTDGSQGPIVALALGLAITLILLIFVGCRLRTVKRRLRKGRALHSNEADYLINGMYL